ncbi:MAG: CotH kinase family protein [Candidatus Solibacter sp.]|nr:CotH kinase family protein [Candidatus Solibacter sp.]
MRLTGLIGTVVAMLALGAPYAAAQTQDDFFDDSFVHEFRIDIRNSDWDQLRKDFLDNTYYPVIFHWIYKGKDIVINDVGIRSRGHGSRSPIKPNLRVDVNRYVPGQKFLGLGSFVLKANNQDPSMRTEYTQRYLNDTNGDLYEWKPIGDGYHFEWTPTCTVKIPLACSTDPAKWAPAPLNPEENKSTFDLAPTIGMIRGFTQLADADFEKTVSTQMDFKLWVFHNAIENYVADYDAILGDVFGMNNFWLYRYAGTNFHQFLLWDKDSSYDWISRPIFEKADQNVLMRRTLALPNRRAEYLESQHKVATLAGGAGGWLEWEIKREYDLAAASIREDTNKQYGDAGVTKNSSNELFEATVLKDFKFVQDRYPFVRQELATAGIQYPTSITLSTGGAVNAATNALGPIAPGSYVSLYGSGFTSSTLSAPSTPFPATLGGVSVFVNGFAAPIQFVSPNQVNIVVPWELGMGNGSAPFTVMVNGPTAKGTRAGSPVNGTFSNSITSAVGPYSPGVFNVAQADGTLVIYKPAKAGDTIVIFANGLGPVTNQPASGAVSPSEPLARGQQRPVVTIGGLPARVEFAGLAPTYVGAYQVNVVVPSGLSSGSAALVITAGGISSPAFSLAIQ